MSVLEFFSELPTEDVAWSRTPGGVTLIRRARGNFAATVRCGRDARLALRYFLRLSARDHRLPVVVSDRHPASLPSQVAYSRGIPGPAATGADRAFGRIARQGGRA